MSEWIQYGAVGILGLVVVLVLRPLVVEGVSSISRLVEAFLSTQHDLLSHHQAVTATLISQQQEASESLRSTVSGKFDALNGTLLEIADQQRKMTAIWENGKCPVKDKEGKE